MLHPGRLLHAGKGANCWLLVLCSLWLLLLDHVVLGETEVDDLHLVLARRVRLRAQAEVLWLDITIDNAMPVNLAKDFEPLDAEVQHGLQVTPVASLLKVVLYAFPEQVHYHYIHHCFAIRRRLLTEMMHYGNGIDTFVAQKLHYFSFLRQHGIRCIFHISVGLHGVLHFCQLLFHEVDLTEGSLAYLVYHAIPLVK